MSPRTIRDDLEERMRGPQRHRLLQGYPMVPLMQRVEPAMALEPPLDPMRPLLIGVLPHPFCNPAISGCGFCTFPHERFGGAAARTLTQAVATEIDIIAERYPSLLQRRIDAVYFGGGTANLTPPDAFRELCERLAARFELTPAEVTLEGVPIYFLTRDAALLHILSEQLPARHRRISMGVQTFDPTWLARMGRTAFGSKADIARVIETAHALGMTASADLLINLPGQRLVHMLEDVRTAIALGFDQVCVYHLVLFDGLNTAWSKDPSLLAGRPKNPQAAAHWRAVRELLLENGFVQTTLTNFERTELQGTDRGFVYERLSFHPEAYDAIGFGPGGISCFSDVVHHRALKWINADASADYLQAINRSRDARDRFFAYDAQDLRLLYLTRKMSLTRVPRPGYRALFGTELLDDFSGEVEALFDAALIRVDDGELVLTSDGMFYADSVAGLLAAPRSRVLRRRNDAAEHHMG